MAHMDGMGDSKWRGRVKEDLTICDWERQREPAILWACLHEGHYSPVPTEPREVEAGVGGGRVSEPGHPHHFTIGSLQP